MMKRWRHRNNGFSMMEMLVTIVIVATFGVAMMGTVLAGQDSTRVTDTMVFFDNRNQNATAVFKTDPSVDYIKDREPFLGMDFDDSTSTFTQNFDKNLQPVSPGDPSAEYMSTYTIDITDRTQGGFKYENKEIQLNIKNFYKEQTNGQFELLRNSAAQGNVRIHANVMEDEKVTSPTTSPTRPTTPTDPTTPTSPTSPTEPTNPPTPEDRYFYVGFVLSEGIFAETGTNTLTKRVKEGSKLGDSIQIDESASQPIIPVQDVDFSPKVSGTIFSGWKYTDGTAISLDRSITGNITIKGDFSAIPNHAIDLSVTISDRNFWDISESDLRFSNQGVNTCLVVNEKTVDGVPPQVAGDTLYPLPGTTESLVGQISNKNAVLPINLQIKYNYVDVKKFFVDNPNMELLFDGIPAPVNYASKFNGSGAKFNLSEVGKVQLGTILGMDPSLITVNLTFVKIPVSYTPGVQGVAGEYGFYLDLDELGNRNRFDGEEYQIKFIQNAPKDPTHPEKYTYKVEIISTANGENILLDDAETGREWGQSIYVTRSIDFNLGSGNIDEIHKLTFFTTGFNIKFASEVNHPDSALRVHNLESYTSKGFENSIPAIGGAGKKGHLRMYGSQQDWISTNFSWIIRINDWRLIDGSIRTFTDVTKKVNCPDLNIITLPLPNRYGVRQK